MPQRVTQLRHALRAYLVAAVMEVRELPGVVSTLAIDVTGANVDQIQQACGPVFFCFIISFHRLNPQMAIRLASATLALERALHQLFDDVDAMETVHTDVRECDRVMEVICDLMQPLRPTTEPPLQWALQLISHRQHTADGVMSVVCFFFIFRSPSFDIVCFS